ncbi:MAG: AAA family ATPase [Asgard group archaeon]|nr:AAA family ATPase [Asgard group archaeon]
MTSSSLFLLVSRKHHQEIISYGTIAHIYGPPKVGKTTFCAMVLLEMALHKKSTFMISTERPIEIRLESIINSNNRYDKQLLDFLYTRNCLTLEDLLQIIENHLEDSLPKFDLLIIDSLTSGYRSHANPIALTQLRELLATLQMYAFHQKIAILFTNQVSSYQKTKHSFRPVASASTRNYSDRTFRMNKRQNNSTELLLEASDGQELHVFSPFTIKNLGIDNFSYLFYVPKIIAKKTPKKSNNITHTS